MRIFKFILAISTIIVAAALVFAVTKMYFCMGLNKKTEQTLAIIKPDAVLAKNSGKIIDKIENENFNILNITKIHLTKNQAKKLYETHKDKNFYKDLIDFMISSPIILMVLEKKGAVSALLKIIGDMDPKKAASKSIRKLYGTSTIQNAIHGSSSNETAKAEISLFFPKPQ